MKIIDEKEFARRYGKSKKILEENPEIADLIEDTLNDPEDVDFLLKCNNILKIPPVKVFLMMKKEKLNKMGILSFGNNDLKQSIGSLIGYYFKSRFNLRNAGMKTINTMGIIRATYFE